MPRIVECQSQDCDNEIEMAVSLYNQHLRLNRKIYCSRICARKSNPKRYDTKYWCDECRKWIPKEQAIMKTNVKHYKKGVAVPTCPKLECNANKLTTKSNRYHTRTVYRKEKEAIAIES